MASLLPSLLHLLPSSPLTNLRPGSSLVFSLEAVAEVALSPGWDQEIKVQVSLTDNSGEEKLISMKKKADGRKRLLEFETSEAGIYQVTATLYDKHISNSPFSIEVVEVDENECETTEEDVIKESSQFMVTEKAVFGFLWKSLDKSFKIKEEQVISRQLTEFIKNIKCSKITSGDDGLVFHFAAKEDLHTMMAQYCPEFISDPNKLSTLSRKFTIIPSRGQYGIFSATPINIQDFHLIAECKIYHSTLWFSNKMDLIKALRDERITRLYSALYIDSRNIMVLQSTRPQAPIKLRSSVGYNSFILIHYDEEKDARLLARLQEDLSWYDAPLSIQPGTQSILKIQMKNEEVAIAAFLGLKFKYPELDIDITGSSRGEIWEIFLTFLFKSSG